MISPLTPYPLTHALLRAFVLFFLYLVIVLGLGLSLFWATLSSEFKLGERCGQLVRTWLYWERPDEVPLRRPVPLLQDEAAVVAVSKAGKGSDAIRFLQRDSHGFVREIVSCRTAATRTLHGVTLTVRPGREMSPSRSRGVELYYVLSGSGVVSQQGIVDTSPIRAGDCFIVDLGKMRWIANPDAIAEDLVLLRVSDGGGPSATGCLGFGDVVRLDPNRRSATTTLEAIKDGVRQAHSMARDYVNGVVE
jgi:mannose-6-phosphate isomerase-like protein (cupin superfamily)